MIGVDKDLGPQDVRSELLEPVDQHQQLFLYSRVIYLSFDEGLACITYGHRLLVRSLPQDRSHCLVDNMLIRHDNT